VSVPGPDQASNVSGGILLYNLFASQVSQRLGYCKSLSLLHNTAVTKQRTTEWPYIASNETFRTWWKSDPQLLLICCFPNCTKSLWIKLLSLVLGGGDRPTLDPPLVSKRLLLYSLSNFKDMYTIALRQTCSQLHHTVVSRSILASRVARFIFSNEAKPSVKKGQQNCWKKPNTQLKKAKKSKTLYLTKPNLLKFASSQLKFT